MEAAAHDHHHHEMPTSGAALTAVAFSATLHCLTGCALGEITGMAIGTALGFSDWGTVALAVALAFLFGYSLTSLPLLRAGLAFSVVVPIALASDTLSIATMEIVDNAIMLLIPGAMEAGLDDVLFWGSLAFALVIAGAVALPVNRWLIGRGKGHVAVHETGIHGGPPTRVVAIAAAVAFVFGSVVLMAEALGSDDEGHGGGHGAAAEQTEADPVRGLAASEDGMTLELGATQIPRGQTTDLSFRIAGEDGRPVREFDTEHERRMHMIVVRRDMTGFQHLHPKLAPDGTWRTPLRVPAAGDYRLFADFAHEDEARTLGADLMVDGPVDWQELPPPSETARAPGGYEVHLDGEGTAGEASELRFSVSRNGEPVAVQPYLGAGGHLVALRQGDLAYLHVHPTSHEDEGGEDAHHDEAEPVAFETEFPTAGHYRLFLQFKHDGEVHTVSFTRTVTGGGDG